MCYDDTKTRFFFFDPETGIELRKHPHHNAIVAAIGEREDDKVTEIWVRPKAPRSVAPYTGTGTPSA